MLSYFCSLTIPIEMIGAYHHWCCELESHSGRGEQHYVIKFSPDTPVSSTNKTGQLRYNWYIVESGVTYHNTNQTIEMLCAFYLFHKMFLKTQEGGGEFRN